MRVFKTEDSNQNMCDTCSLSIAECKPYIIDFGDGLGHDNVIKCSCYTGQCINGISIINEIVSRRTFP